MLYEFDGFRVDPVRRVLLRDGEPVAVTPKALSILLVLLERPGEVVEKPDLIERIWPGVFVTEANLTQNIFSLRKSLGERANDNRYIVTVPGRGYSFAGELRRTERFPTAEIQIIPVDMPLPAAVPPATAELPIVVPGLPPSQEIPILPPAPGVPAAPPHRPWGWKHLWQGTAVAAALVILVFVGDHVLRHLGPTAKGVEVPSAASGATTVRRAVAVLDFRSLSPSAETRWLETAFAEMLATELGAAGDLRVIRGETVAEAMRSLDFRDPTSLSQDDLLRLRDALGADLLVIGSYVPMRDKIRVDLRVVQIPGGDTVASLAEVGTQAGLFELVSRTGSRLRNSLGVSALSPEQVRQARALRPSNNESSRLYAEGLARLHDFDPPGALALLQRAAEADPESAVIHSALSRNWWVLGYDRRAADEGRLALNLAGSLSREERLLAEARLHQAAKQWQKASEAYRSLWTFYPDDIEYGLQLVDTLTFGGRGNEAKPILADLRTLPRPTGDDPRIDLAEAKNARRLSDLEGEKRAAEVAVAKGRRSGQSLMVAQGLIYQGDALIALGRAREALPLFRESVELARRAGYQWGIGMGMANLGVGLQAVGDLDGAERAYAEALGIAQRLGSGIGMAAQLQILGGLHLDRGELDESLRYFEQARQWFIRVGDRLNETRVVNSSGVVLRSQGNLAGAQQRFEKALSLSQALGNRAEQALALDNLGSVMEARGELGEAKRRHEEAFAILHQAGDTGATALALTGIASTAARIGDLRTAWQRASQALAIYQRAGDRIGAGRVLGLRARLAYEMGNLAESRSSARDQLRTARETGGRSLTAMALQNLGRADFAAGDVAASRGELTEALQVSLSLGEELRAMEIRLDLAHLALASGQPGEAARLAEGARDWCRARGIAGCELDARSSLAEALLAQGRRREAMQAAGEARLLADTSQDRSLRIRAAIRLANVEAAGGDPRAAMLQLRRAVEDAAGLGLTAAGLGARLALGELQREVGDPAAKATLAAVGKDAASRGFKRMAEIAAGPMS
ncbi:MAG: tetratricopeptide repeat protein [Thermoanaerobaculia bacterium]